MITVFPKPKSIMNLGGVFSGAMTMTIERNDFDVSLLKCALSKLKIDTGGSSLQIIKTNLYKDEEYKVRIDESVQIFASTEKGVFYALVTLSQILTKGNIPKLEIHDWPDYEFRGCMLDVSRCKIPKIQTLKEIIDLLSALKFNQLQLYFEGAVFEYKGFEDIWEGKNPITSNYIREISGYCLERMIELVPNQNAFGHMAEWLKIGRLRHLAECEEGFYRTDEYGRTAWRNPSTLNPLDEKSINFVKGLFDDVLPNFSGSLIHVGCDETFELGQGKSKKMSQEIGIAQVYYNYLTKIYDLCRAYGRKMMFWADMVINCPHIIAKLPKDSIPVVWGYEEDHPFAEQCSALNKCGLNFYVAPGTSSWGSLVGRSENMVKNQLIAAQSGKKYGAKGFLLTDWGDGGHPQFSTISYVPFAYGGGLSWGGENNNEINGALTYLDTHFFQCSGFAKYIYSCGNAYQYEAYRRFNQTAAMSVLNVPFRDNIYMNGQEIDMYQDMSVFINKKIKECEIFQTKPEFKHEITLNLFVLDILVRILMLKLGKNASKKEIMSLVTTIDTVNEKFIKLWCEKNYAYNYMRFVDNMNRLKEELLVANDIEI